MKYRFRAWVVYSLIFQYLVIGGYSGVAMFIAAFSGKNVPKELILISTIGILGLIYALSLVFWPYKRRHKSSPIVPASTPASIPSDINDPFAERDEIDAGLLAANSFIRAGRYTEARDILEPIKSDPKAAEWLKKLSDPKYK
jgi:hypothetical protein